ncbi:heme-thiolate peroxidase [Echria macrotheca]|uniref:Heme-thiolate peroxidase n=1 Tax=Echria macrotheca TaxID=438768 RepID=A0AAJ0FE98_9PEZI|nr:heme-thiolate peroxidase [Echria macrotheca]
MKIHTQTFLAVVAASPAIAGFDSWTPPGPYDVRAPCPMLNTLANHGFLPHDGKDIDKETTETALFEALNINKTLGGFLFDFAITTNPKPNSTTFSLNDLGNHNVLEHDASLSRSDAFYGSALTFNQTVFDETQSYWTNEVINIEMAAHARVARIKTSQATNPTYSLSNLGSEFSFGESVAYVVLLGDKVSGTANRSWVQFFFEHERLPLHLGWHKPDSLFQEEDLFGWMDVMRNITQNETDAAPAVRLLRGRSHFGW